MEAFEKVKFYDKIRQCTDENEKLTLIRKNLKKKLTYDRYIHTLNVASTCQNLAMSIGYDIQKAYIAGLLHDCAKCISDEKKIKMCKKHKIEITQTELKSPYLLHAKLGAYLACTKYNVTNTDILNAIECHTTGKPGMSQLDLILFVADYIEPGRNKADNLRELRMEAYKDLTHCAYLITKQSLDYLGTTNNVIDEATSNTYEYYKKIYE